MYELRCMCHWADRGLNPAAEYLSDKKGWMPTETGYLSKRPFGKTPQIPAEYKGKPKTNNDLEEKLYI